MILKGFSGLFLCRREFEQGKAIINGGKPPLPPPSSTLQNQDKTEVLPVLPTTAPLAFK